MAIADEMVAGGVVGLLTTGETAHMLGVHPNTVRKWSNDGLLVAYRIGPRGDRRFRAEDIAVLLLEENKGFQINIEKEN